VLTKLECRLTKATEEAQLSEVAKHFLQIMKNEDPRKRPRLTVMLRHPFLVPTNKKWQCTIPFFFCYLLRMTSLLVIATVLSMESKSKANPDQLSTIYNRVQGYDGWIATISNNRQWNRIKKNSVKKTNYEYRPSFWGLIKLLRNGYHHMNEEVSLREREPIMEVLR